MEEQKIKQRLADNLYRLTSGKKVAIFPYGYMGKCVEKILREEWKITPSYRIDNHLKGESIISFEDFSHSADLSKVVVIIAVEDFILNREWLGKFFEIGVKADSIIMIKKQFIAAYEAMEKVIGMPNAKTVLDVGCGIGLQGRIFQDYGKKVLGITASTDDAYGGRYISDLVFADYMKWETDEKFDVVWMSHILEHIRDVEGFLLRTKKYVKEGGVLAITVPASENIIVLTHIHYFNAGKLLRYLVGAGFDCRKAEIRVYGDSPRNLSIILPDVSFIPEEFDLTISEAEQDGWREQEKIWKYIPEEVNLMPTWQDGEYYFNGEIEELNWKKAGTVL